MVGEEDSFDVDDIVSSGDTITVRMTALSGTLEPKLELYDGSGTLIATTYAFSGGTATLTETLSTAGPYALLTSDRGNDATGDYSLFLQRVSEPCGAINLSCGQRLVSSLSTVAEHHSYSLSSLNQGDTITVRMTALSGTLEPKLELYDGSGTLIATTYAFSGGTATLTETLSTAGPYALLTSDRGNDATGDYSLFLQRVSNPCDPVDLSCGQRLTSSLSTVAEHHSYSLSSLSQGDTITVRMTALSGTLKPKLELYDGSGTLIATIYAFSGGTATLNETLRTAGPYTLLASDRGNDATGDYSLFLQRVSNPCDPVGLSCGQRLTSSLSPVAEHHSYSLSSLSQGDTITVRMTALSGTLEPKLEFYDGSGTLIATIYAFSGGTATLNETLSTAGPYTLLTSDRGNDATGDYSLFLQRVSSPCGATPLNLGQTSSAAISPPPEIATYSLQGVAPQDTVTVCMDAISAALEPAIELYDGSGNLLGSDFDFGGGTASVLGTLSAPAPFTVLAMDRGHDAIGDYEISLRGAVSACATTDTAGPTVGLAAPEPGELVAAGSQYRIRWSSADDVGVTSHTVRLSTDSGATFPTLLASGLSGAAQSYLWTVPVSMRSTTARIRVVAQDATGASGQAETAGDFAIIDDPPPREITYSYDSLNRLVGVEYSDGSAITYVYDEVGNRETLTSTGPVVIYADDFESGATSGWSETMGSVAASSPAARSGAFGLRVDVGCTGSGDVQVPDGTIPSGVYEGCSSVRADAVQVDPGPVTFRAGERILLGHGFSVGSGARFTAEIDPGLVPDAYLGDGSPDNEERYGAGFSFKLDGLDLAAADQVELFAGYDASGVPQFRLILERSASGTENRLFIEARRDDGTTVSTAGNAIPVPAGWHSLEVNWRAASLGWADGRLDLALDGTPQARLTNLDNDSGRIDFVRLGATGAGPASGGFIDLDDFRSQPQL